MAATRLNEYKGAAGANHKPGTGTCSFSFWRGTLIKPVDGFATDNFLFSCGGRKIGATMDEEWL